MADINQLPFNIELLLLSDQDIKSVRPVKVLDIFDGMSKNFHPDGLFSTETFGKVGGERRNRMFSYIKLGIDILHPVIYFALCDLKSLYGDIMSGKTFVTYNPKTKDFDESNPVDGQTGYAYFMSMINKLEFEARPSPARTTNIALLKKYKDRLTYRNMIVLPAGLRDYEIDETGKPSEDEINPMYRKVFSIAGVINNVNAVKNEEYLNSARFQLQRAVNDIYLYIENMLKGKNGYVLDKWANRKVYNSTRNVITSYSNSTKHLEDPTSVGTNNSIVGLYQYLRATLPLSIKLVRDTYLTSVFVGPNSPAVLVNSKTLKKEMVTVDADYYDSWMTDEGLEKLFAKYGREDLRHDYLKIGEHYLLLIYKGRNGDVRVLQDIDDLPEGYDRELVTPITLTELLYLSVFEEAPEVPCLITRYPVSGYGSIYPSYVYLKTTVNSEIRYVLDGGWERSGVVCPEFPVFKELFYNSVSLSESHLSRLAATI